MVNFDEIQRIYIAYLNRPADPLGLIYWAGKLDETRDIHAVARAFFFSEEFRSRNPDSDPASLIRNVYKACLGREPDPEGFSFWLEAVKKNIIPVELIPLEMVKAAKSGDDLKAISNKIKSAMNFVKVLDPELDGKDFLANFSGETDIHHSRMLIEFVKSDERTVLDIEDCEIFVSSRIADPEDQILKRLSSKMGDLLKVARDKSFKVESFTELPSSLEREVIPLLSGVSWGKDEITFSFLLSGSPIYGDVRHLSPLQKEVVRLAFEKISKIVDLKFREVSYGGDIEIVSASLPRGVGGMTTYYFSGGSFSKPVVIYLSNLLQDMESRYFLKKDWGISGYGVLLIYHEILHALGLKHPFEGTSVLEKSLERIPWTIMGYFEGRTFTPFLRFVDGKYEVGVNFDAIPDGPGILDLHALISIYGPNLQEGRGDDTYHIGEDQSLYRIIWDSGGRDLIDLSKVKGVSLVNLDGGTLSSVGLKTLDVQVERLISCLNLSGAEKERLWLKVREYLEEVDSKGLLYNGEGNLAILKGCVIEDLRTGEGNDVVYDNFTDNLIELNGGDDTVILGKGGFDTVHGGSGYDVLILPCEKRAYSIFANPDFVLITHEKHAVKLIGFEEVRFADEYLLV